jgi:ABC-type lipoprotein export system ATPase subunit
MEPAVLLADEPSGHQDADGAATVFQALRWIAAKGTSCLVPTHSQEFLRLVDHVVTMHDGQLIQRPLTFSAAHSRIVGPWTWSGVFAFWDVRSTLAD